MHFAKGNEGNVVINFSSSLHLGYSVISQKAYNILNSKKQLHKEWIRQVHVTINVLHVKEQQQHQ